MKLISITITSSTKENIIGDALRSVIDWVDEVLIVHIPDPSEDKTLEIAKQIAGPKLKILEVSGDLGTAGWRNAGLEEVERLGADWSVQLDTDERILINGADIRKSLEKLQTLDPEIGLLTVLETTGIYDKFRFIRHPTEARFSQSFHEELTPKPKYTVFPKVRFSELPKSQEKLKQNLQNQVLAMKQQIQTEPENPRWYYYLGSALEELGNYQEAIEAYQSGSPWIIAPNSHAWNYFRIGSCYMQLKHHKEIIRSVLEGMIHQPNYPELPWLASISYYQVGEMEKCIEWAKIAAINNWSRKKETEINRIGFKQVDALFEGPYMMMAEAYKVLKQLGNQQWAEGEGRRARKARIQLFEKGIS